MAKIIDHPIYSPEQIRVMQQPESERILARAKEAEEHKTQEKEFAEKAKMVREERQKEIAAEEKKFLEESSKNLEALLREQFFRANPNAFESDFERVKDRLKDEHFIDRMKGEQKVSETFLKDQIRM